MKKDKETHPAIMISAVLLVGVLILLIALYINMGTEGNLGAIFEGYPMGGGIGGSITLLIYALAKRKENKDLK